MSNLDWSIPVAQYTQAHWDAIEAQERAKEERKSFYLEMDDEYARQERREFYENMGFDYDALRQGFLVKK